MKGSSPPLPSDGDQVAVIGVGIDTGRYAHHATFLDSQLQLAATPLEVPESAAGYQRLGATFQQLHERHPSVVFRVHVDAGGQYATNLIRALHQFPWPISVSLGDPVRNSAYRKSQSPKRKADPVDSRCLARFAVVERPAPSSPIPEQIILLREITSRLEAQVRHGTRLVNQLHNLMSRVFPELATQVPDLSANWVLLLLAKYPTPQRIARARIESLAAIHYACEAKVKPIQDLARHSVGSLPGSLAEQMVRQMVGLVQDNQKTVSQTQAIVEQAYRPLADVNHLVSINGIGSATAAVLTAKIVDINRFDTPEQLVAYFGVFPEESSSGFTRHGVPHPPGTRRMSAKGNDLVRRYLWMAARSAITCNPACRALYHRLRQRGTRGDVALGHVMRKLLHLVFAVWKSGRRFDPDHYPWQTPQTTDPQTTLGPSKPQPTQQNAAGHKQDMPLESVVTAAPQTVGHEPAAVKVAPPPARPRHLPPLIAHVRQQVTMEQVLQRLGHLGRLKGGPAQRRGPCPLHEPDQFKGHSFSVNLERGIFNCFHPTCAAHGNVVDLWAAVHRLPPAAAARELAELFGVPLPAARGHQAARTLRNLPTPNAPSRPSRALSGGTRLPARPKSAPQPPQPVKPSQPVDSP